ncbi:maltose ABC transporter substrate-binding protein [[Brevibacterium] frigoritolerans]|nr:maltose ABC transporter substrate-binding protein [Peribacillus frigoritolerans]
MELKKVFAVLATGVLASTLLAGCASPAKEKEETKGGSKTETVTDIKPEKGATLVVWDNKDGEQKWAQYVAKEFEKKYDVPVKFQNVDHTKSVPKMEKDGPAGKGADVFNAPHDQLGKLVNAGLVYENVFEDEYKESFMDAAVSAVSYKDDSGKKMYGYPLAIETYSLLYNKDLVKKPATTMDELFKQAKAFTNVKENKFGLMMEPANYYYVHAFVGGYGGYVFGEDGTDVKDIGLNTKKAAQAGELMQKIHNDLLPLKKEDLTGDVIGSLFNSGKVMYRVTGPWDIQGAKDNGINVGVTPLPKLDNGKSPTNFSGIKAYYVNASSKYPKAASLFAKFASSEEMLLKRYELTSQIPPHKGLLTNEKIQKDEVAMAYLESAKTAVPMPSIPEMQLVWPAMETAYTEIWNSKEDPKKILDSGVKQIEEAMKIQQK